MFEGQVRSHGREFTRKHAESAIRSRVLASRCPVLAPAPLSMLVAAYCVRTQLPKVADARDKLLSVIVPVMHAHHTLVV